jgi:ferredoxin
LNQQVRRELKETGGDEKPNPARIETCVRAEARHNFFKRKGQFMADVANKYSENVAGKYYVDNQCIDCDLCRETAPDNFKRNDDGGYSFVYKQPESPEEEGRCKEAKEGCPVEAIGDNGA